ncbi:bifunctional adenosylcobinamide kinase/adenosylcobinamide-phosphate guanylyltransferase [Teredinibacter franksiae]|uniref:bifunctional adenosylcobinamide kinase/adenosylcobinamide-phosphate guanylyltransferase n=1 Tax=Teredinibacter franksiae TaxID=2761453 RepID=UPI001629DE3B|nr:bifunctional adenosylcobinamide kinase/adenosylcobinamide-phosphate guanylyltransferase [Teredinibacter franksiae]
MKQLILGGARSGKSRLAETRAKATGKKRVYLATGQAGDNEMAERIAIHKQSRETDWQLIEEPTLLSRALSVADSPETAIVVDCLTLWLSNCVEQSCFLKEKQKLLNTIYTLQADVFFVSNEVGSGIVPLGELSRTFVDESGWLHQALAEQCDTVTLVVAGLPLELKGASKS